MTSHRKRGRVIHRRPALFLKSSTLGSALTCQRFGQLRCIATRLKGHLGESGDRSPHSKVLNLPEQFFDDSVTRLECFAEFFWLSAAAFGHIGFAATLAADNRR